MKIYGLDKEFGTEILNFKAISFSHKQSQCDQSQNGQNENRIKHHVQNFESREP